MCMSAPKVSTPTYKAPATPPSPEPVAEAPSVDEGTKRTSSRGTEGNTSSTGTRSLRIDLNVAQPSGGSGLNIPQ